MKNLLISFVLLLLLSGSLVGQSKTSAHRIKFDEIHHIDSVSLYCDNLIDLRIDKEIIGTVHTGANNVLEYAKLSKHYDINIVLLLKSLLPQKTGDDKIIILLHQLIIGERITLLYEESTCVLELEFAKMENDSLFSYGKYSSFKTKRSLDATYAHDNNIIDAVRDCVIAYENDSTKLNRKYIDKSYFETKLDYQNLPKDGCYTNFRTLARNEPSYEYIGALIQLNAEGTQFDYKPSNKNVNPNETMFIVNKGDMFINATHYCGKNYFVKVKQYGKYIYFEDKYKKNETAAILGGIIGGGIGVGIASSVGGGSTHSLVLDTTTEKIYLLNIKNLYEIIKPYKDIVKAYRKSKRKRKDREAAIEMLNTHFK